MRLKTIKYNRWDFQKEFSDSTEYEVMLSAGYGAGKTYAVCMELIKLANLNRGLPGGLLCPNMKMFRRDVWPTLKDIARENGFEIEYKRSDAEIFIPITNTTIYIFHSEDDGDSIRGPNIAFGIVNEVSMCAENAYKAFLARVRLKTAPHRQIKSSGTPEGFGWTYDYFVLSKEPTRKIIYGDTRKNKAVAEDYHQRLLNSYDSVMAEMYVGGRYVNLSGKSVLHQFDRTKHAINTFDVSIPDDAATWCSIDFNVDPMAATLYKVWRIANGRMRLHGFAEVNISGADTDMLARELLRLNGGRPDGIALFPDPAGKARSTRGRTDIKILESYGFDDLRYKSRIASVRDCVNAANSYLAKGLVTLDPNECSETIKDFEQVVWVKGAWEMNKTDHRRTHWVDGFKNMIDFEFPVTQAAGGWRPKKAR